MADLANCPNCGTLFVKNKFRSVCEKCWKEEEKAFDLTREFIRKRENRTATIEQVVKGTGVEQELILKFIKEGRLNLNRFPNLGYPCDRCGRIIQKGRLCERCSGRFKSDLEQLKKQEERKKEREKQITYFAIDERYRGGDK